MGKFRLVQSSFAYGLLSEEAASRSDLDFVKQGCSELSNFVIESIGGIRKRIGCHLVSSSVFPGYFHDVRILPIKGTNNKFLCYGKSSTGSTFFILDASYKIQITVGSVVGKVLSIIQVGDIFIFTNENSLPQVIFPSENTYRILPYQKFLLKDATDNATLALQYKFLPFEDWNLNANEKLSAAATSGDTTLLFSKGANPAPFFSPYGTGELYAANYLVNTTWSKALWEAKSVGISTISGIIRQTAEGKWRADLSPDLYNHTYFEAVCSAPNDPVMTEGKLYYLKKENDGADYFRVADSYNNLILGTYLSTVNLSARSFVTITKLSSIPVTTRISPVNTNQTYVWSKSQWSYLNGYPKKVSFVGTRLSFAGNNKDSEAIWMSNSANIFQFNSLRFKMDVTATSSDVDIYGALGDSDAHLTRATSAQYNRTSWIVNADELTVGCQGGIFILNRSSTGDFLPLKTTSSAISYDSAADIEPTMMEFGIVFVDQSRKSLKFLDFRSEKKGVNDISLLVTGKFTNIQKILYQRSTKVLWVLDDNSIKSFTLSTFTNVAGFAEHNISFPADGWWSTVKDIFLDSDDKLCILAADIFASYSVCVFENDETDSPVFLDFWTKQTSLTDITEWTFAANELRLFNDFELTCTVDGVASTGTVSNDGATFTSLIAGKDLIVGLPITARMKTLNLDPNGVLGSAVGAIKRPDEVVLKVKDTQNMRVGGKTLYVSKTTASKYSGEVVEKVAADPSTDSRITVESSGNYPCHILSMTFKGFTQE